LSNRFDLVVGQKTKEKRDHRSRLYEAERRSAQKKQRRTSAPLWMSQPVGHDVF
jgi:hypothetical protein